MQQKVPFTGPVQQKVPFTGLAPKLFPSWCQTAFFTTSLKLFFSSPRLTLECARLSLTATSSFFFLCADYLSLLALWPQKALSQDNFWKPFCKTTFQGHLSTKALLQGLLLLQLLQRALLQDNMQRFLIFSSISSAVWLHRTVCSLLPPP